MEIYFERFIRILADFAEICWEIDSTDGSCSDFGRNVSQNAIIRGVKLFSNISNLDRVGAAKIVT